MKIASCRSCGKPILWAQMPSGKMNCFDVARSFGGMWALDDRTYPPKAVKIGPQDGLSEDGFTSHFATCPKAAEHRRKR